MGDLPTSRKPLALKDPSEWGFFTKISFGWMNK